MLVLCLIRAPLLRHAPCPTQVFQSSIMVLSDCSDPDSECDDYQKLFDALNLDFMRRKIYTLQSAIKKPAELWTMQEYEASTSDLDNNYESLKVIVETIPHAVASAIEIQSMLIKIDSQHENCLSASREKKSQKHWAAGEAHTLWCLWSYIRKLWRRAPKAAHSKKVEALKNLMVKRVCEIRYVGSSPHSSPARGQSMSLRSSCSQSPRRPSRGRSPGCADSQLGPADEKEEELFIPKPPKPGERPKPGYYRDEDETKADLRASQAREEKKMKLKKDDSTDEDSDSKFDDHLPQPKRLKWDEEVEILGKSPCRSPIKIKKIHKKPAAAKDRSGADSESESNQGEPTPKKRAGKPKITTPPPPPKRTAMVTVGDKKWEARWKDLLSILPKECMPRHNHGEANWTMTDSDGTTSIQVQAKTKSFYIVKTKTKYQGPKTINVVRDFAGNFYTAWSDVKKKAGWSGISKAI